MPSEREAEISTALQAVRQRIAAGCEAAGRDPVGVTLVVVTKTYPASDVRILAGLGVQEVGENRDQEAAPKAEETKDLDLRWHFVGRLQSNKARHVPKYAEVVHSVDRMSLLAPLTKGADEVDRILWCFVQVSLDGDTSRGGAVGDDVYRIADTVAETAGLGLAGVMAVAPLGEDPDRAFGRLREISEKVRETNPTATGISAGMSGDLEQALRHDATHLRVGSAVLGERPPLR